jgi:hypothetical protein
MRRIVDGIIAPVLFLVAVVIFQGFEWEYSEEEAELYKIDIHQVTPDSGITTGHIIAYGHYIKPPYKIEVRDTIVYINGVQILPRLIPPGKKKKKQEAKTSKTEYEIANDSIWATYDSLRQKYDKSTSYKKIIEYVRNLDVVDSVVANSNEVSAVIYYKNGARFITSFHHEYTPPPELSPEERREERIKYLEQESESIRKSLEERRRLIIFSYRGDSSRPGMIIYDIIRIMSNEELSTSEKAQNLIDNRPRYPHLTQDEIYEIMANFDHEEWESVKVRGGEER